MYTHTRTHLYKKNCWQEKNLWTLLDKDEELLKINNFLVSGFKNILRLKKIQLQVITFLISHCINIEFQKHVALRQYNFQFISNHPDLYIHTKNIQYVHCACVNLWFFWPLMAHSLAAMKKIPLVKSRTKKIISVRTRYMSIN